MILRPFFTYFGAKWRAAPHYPPPTHPTVIEPFAGAAGYALRHHTRAFRPWRTIKAREGRRPGGSVVGGTSKEVVWTRP